jgi:DNA-binding Lrp family transcriptional regulator
MPQKNTRAEVLAAFEKAGRSPKKAAEILGVTERALHERLARIEAENGILIRNGAGTKAKVVVSRSTHPNPIELHNGVIVVGSDAHYWPGEASTAHRAFVKICKLLDPAIVVMNGDEFDGASVSRHGPIGWEERPDVWKEIEVLQERLHEIKMASRNAHHLGTFGNHTIRLDTFLAGHAAQVRGVFGTKFEDHVPGWTYNWAYLVNGHTLIKHRLRGGVHATWNNTSDTHLNTVTGHCHALQVRPRTTMSPLNGGTIYGVDTGMLADPWGPQFGYVEQGPRNWRSGFAVLTFNNGQLMPPELCQVVADDLVFFRGNTIRV